uniref:Uncharacterized protein n=1 Tax=Arundo donax TaxID=35708 RepID=A0A0A9ACA7_ARUDO
MPSGFFHLTMHYIVQEPWTAGCELEECFCSAAWPSRIFH